MKIEWAILALVIYIALKDEIQAVIGFLYKDLYEHENEEEDGEQIR